MKKIFLVTIGILLISFLASAQIIGGEVTADGPFSPAWQNVFVYDVDNPSNYKEVQVSPDQYRYSFSNAEIFSQNAILRAEILDFENNIMTRPTEINLSLDNSKEYGCSDCDIFDRIELNNIFQLESPSQDVYISQTPNFYLEPNTFHECKTYILKNGIYEELTEESKNQTGVFGKNEFYIIADCNVGKRFKSANIPIEFANSEQQISYKKTIENKGNYLLVNFFGAKTSGVSTITDFTSDEYEIYDISNGGIAYDEDGYYAIEWQNTTTESFSFTYKIKPKPKFLSCEMGLEGIGLIKKSMNEKLENTKFINGEEELIDISDKKFYIDCNFSQKISFYIIEDINIKRNSESILKNQKSKIKLQIKLSQKIENVYLKEYIPKMFEVYDISSSGQLDESNPDYNMITWKVSGKNIDVSYRIKSLKLGTQEFFTELGGELISQSSVKVPTIIPTQKENNGGSSSSSKKKNIIPPKIYKYIPENFSLSSPTNPLIAKQGNLLVALYPNLFKLKSSIDLYEFLYDGFYDRRLDYLKSYNILTNLNSTEKGKMLFEYEINKSDLESKNYKDIKFYSNNNGIFSPLTGRVVYSDDNSVKYSFESNESISKLFIFGEKQKLELRDKIIIFIEKVFSYLLKFRQI